MRRDTTEEALGVLPIIDGKRRNRRDSVLARRISTEKLINSSEHKTNSSKKN